MYSFICIVIKRIAKIIVTKKPKKAYSYKPPRIALCAQVIEAPDVKSKRVFNRGTPYGLNTDIPTGGHSAPTHIEGAKLEWKNAQKKAKKNIISEAINKIKPIFKPRWTILEWKPKKVDSLITSRHQVTRVTVSKHKPVKAK